MSHTILFIEDNISNVELVRILAESAGYTVLTAFEGKEGIALALEQSPDLIICDYHLPYMNGIEIIELLRADDRTRYFCRGTGRGIGDCWLSDETCPAQYAPERHRARSQPQSQRLDHN